MNLYCIFYVCLGFNFAFHASMFQLLLQFKIGGGAVTDTRHRTLWLRWLKELWAVKEQLILNFVGGATTKHGENMQR